MSKQHALTAMDEWTAVHHRRDRGVRVAVLGAGLVTALVVTLANPPGELTQSALLIASAVFALGTGVSFLPGFKAVDPVTLCVMSLLDFAAIGTLGLIPQLQMFGTVLVLMPAMWLGGTLGRKGAAVAALAAAVLVVAPRIIVQGGSATGWPTDVSTILFATLGALGIALTIEMWNDNVLTLEQQGDELRNAVSVKDDFIALVSHELRTPLTSIIGYLDLVIDGDEALPDEALHHLTAVSRNADRLLLLVTDLLSAHQTESVPMKLVTEPLDVAALAKLSLDDAEQRATEAGLTITRDLPPGMVLSADPNRLLQVLDNLMSNAIKFTPPGGCISVTLRRQSPGVDLMVTDTGVGIDAISLQHVGKKFFRSPKTTKAAVPGIGLGLMITKAIIEAHHGSLTIASEEGEGTSVLVHLPPGAAATPEAHRRSVHARPKVSSRDIS